MASPQRVAFERLGQVSPPYRAGRSSTLPMSKGGRISGIESIVWHNGFSSDVDSLW
jgi:hypothetical protein